MLEEESWRAIPYVGDFGIGALALPPRMPCQDMGWVDDLDALRVLVTCACIIRGVSLLT